MVRKHSRHNCMAVIIRKRTRPVIRPWVTRSGEDSYPVNLFSQMWPKYMPKLVKE